MLHTALIIAVLLMAAVEIFLYRMLRGGCALRLPVRSASWTNLPGEPVASFRMDSTWASELAELASLPDEQARATAGMAWLMNRVHTVERPVKTGPPEQMLAAIESGEGALCGQMAYLFRHVLASLGLSSRTIYLQRNPFDCFDDHTLVEVMVAGRWILFDPTFNLIFRGVDGRLLNAFEIKEKVFLGKNSEVRPEFLGEVRYPPRSEDYYIGLLSLFCNVYMRTAGSPGLGRLPPMRYFLGPRLYYVAVAGESDNSMAVWRRFYASTVLLLPIGMIIIAAVTMLLVVLGH
jgi:hypothetical protein